MNFRKRRKRKGKSSQGLRPRPRPKGLDHYLSAYSRLMDTHLEARKRYYDLFYRVDSNRLAKLEKTFSSTMSAVRAYERSIPENYKKDFFSTN